MPTYPLSLVSLRGAAFPLVAGAVSNTGWVNLTTFSNDAAIGTIAWGTPGDAAASDNIYASMASGAGSPNVSNYLKGLQLTSGVPGGATIVGVEVRVEKSQVSAGYTDNSVRLVKGGVISGNNKADTITAWPTVDAYITYGGAADLWGLALTAADVNGATFGLVIASAQSANFRSGSVDHMQMKIYYSTP